MGERPIAGARIVVTGATSGIGRELARGLARRGAALTLVARDEARAAAAAREFAAERGSAGVPEVVLGDLADLGSVRHAAAVLHERYESIDVLVNNAGMRSFSPQRTADGFEAMMGTNHFGPFLLTNLLLDLLEAAAPARIVITASEAHRGGGRPDLDRLGEEPSGFNPAVAERLYAASKLMNILFTQELARRVAGTGVTANCFCPGVVATGLIRDIPLVERAGDLLARTPLIRRAEQGARMGVRLVVDPELDGVSGEFFTSTPGLRFLPTAGVRRDADFQRRAWKRTAELVGLSADK